MEEYAFQGTCHAGAWCMNLRLVVVELPKEEGCCDGGHAVGGSDANPHAVCSPDFGEYQEEGHEEHQLSAHRHEDASFSHADALEEVACHNLEAHDGGEDADDAHSSG